MRLNWISVVAVSGLCLLPWVAMSPSHAQAGSASAQTARVIVKFKTASGQAKIQAASGSNAAVLRASALSARTGLGLRDGRAIAADMQVVLASGITSAQLAARLSNDSDVDYAVVDERRFARAVPNDPYYAGGQAVITPAAGQWYLRAPAGGVVSAINAEGAWNRATGAGVVVAVLDTGVRFDHPDLAAKLYPGYDFVTDTDTANDGSARDSDASDPGDWVTSAEVAAAGTFRDCDAEDSSWHGTQTAGLIGAAANNGIGMSGVGADVMVLPLRVLGKCGGYDSDIIAAMLWAAGLNVPGVPANTHVAKVMNLSLGSNGACSQAYMTALSQVNGAGSVVVVSAGNDGLAVNAPANCPGAIAVAGVRHSGTKVGYSSLGPEVAISAPAGNCVNLTGACLYPLLTSTNSGTTGPAANTYSNGTNISIGTSFAAPLVAGTAALMLSAQPSLTPTQVLNNLKSAARAFPTTGAGSGVAACRAPDATAQDSECYCTSSTCGAGLLDANAALTRVLPTAPALLPVISYSANTALQGGVSFTADSARSVVPTGRTVQYAWSVDSTAFASITSATNASTVTLLPSASGTVVVHLSLTDDLGNVATRDISVPVAGPAPPTTTPPAGTPLPSGGDGGGGGALGPAWLLGLGLAVMTLCVQRKRRAGV